MISAPRNHGKRKGLQIAAFVSSGNTSEYPVSGSFRAYSGSFLGTWKAAFAAARGLLERYDLPVRSVVWYSAVTVWLVALAVCLVAAVFDSDAILVAFPVMTTAGTVAVVPAG